MELSYQLAEFLDDIDVEFEVIPNRDGSVSVEFTHDKSFYEVEFPDNGKVIVNGETMTYRDLISNIF